VGIEQLSESVLQRIADSYQDDLSYLIEALIPLYAGIDEPRQLDAKPAKVIEDVAARVGGGAARRDARSLANRRLRSGKRGAVRLRLAFSAIALALIGASCSLARGAAEDHQLVAYFTDVGDLVTRATEQVNDVEIGTVVDDFQELLASLDKVPSDVGPERTRRVIENLSPGLLGRSEDIAAIPESFGTLSDAFADTFLHAVEDSSIPWRSPDGREFYRIRVGLVVDNFEESWPCKYRLPEGYERFPRERTERMPITGAECRGRGRTESTESLVTALQQWAEENPAALPHLPFPPFGDFDPRSGDQFIWPVRGELTSGFGPRSGGMHTGLDIDADTGTPVVAAWPGKVVLTDEYYGYGSTVIIDHGDEFSSLYGHLSEFATKSGQRVERGEVVGLVGCTGTCTGDHLHFEIRIEEDSVNPLPYLPERNTTRVPVPEETPSPDETPLSQLTGNI
jgi:hypothetical protein